MYSIYMWHDTIGVFLMIFLMIFIFMLTTILYGIVHASIIELTKIIYRDDIYKTYDTGLLVIFHMFYLLFIVMHIALNICLYMLIYYFYYIY